MSTLKKFLPIILLLLLSIGAILPLFHQGFFPMHDDEQIARLYDLDQALLAGNIPPRISPNLGFGYGYPFFNFYPSFAYYVGELFHLMGFSYILSTKLMLASGFMLSAVFMFLFVKELFGKTAGVVSAIAYVYASYHAVDVYVRGAFAEFFAFVFIPLIFWSILKLQDSKKIYYILAGALGIGGLILSHNLIALMTAPFLAVWGLYILYNAKNKLQFIIFSLAMLLLGLGLTAYFWLPSYLEKGYTLINILTSELANYNLHFVCVHQLWSSPWGYGGSIPSCFDGISFEIGKIHLILSFFALCFASFLFIRRKQKKQTVVTLLFVGFLLVSSFLMTKYAKPIWDSVSLFWYIQFPWRFLLLTAFFSSLLCGSIIAFIKNKKLKIVLAFIFIICLISFNLFRFTPERYLDVTDKDYTNVEKLRWFTSSLAYEYVPKEIATKKSAINTTLIAINKDEIATKPAQVITGEMFIKTQIDKPHIKKLEVEVLKPGILQINTFSFPEWTVFVDNKKVAYTDNNKLKLLRITLSPGQHTVEARFEDTPVRITGNIISLFSIIVFIVLTFVAIRKKHAKNT